MKIRRYAIHYTDQTREPLIVEGEYYRVDHGALNVRVTTPEYPETLLTVAHGIWSHVVLLPPVTYWG